jgi:hypothetical protein
MDFRERCDRIPVAEIQVHVWLLQLWEERVLPSVGALGSVTVLHLSSIFEFPPIRIW